MQKLLLSIFETIKDYCQDDSYRAPMTPEHVGNWVSQFEASVQIPILEEMDYVLKKTYLNKEKVKNCLSSYLTDKDIAGDNPELFWKNCFFLREGNQLNGVRGNSQEDFLNIFDELLQQKFGYRLDDCKKQETDQYIYLDDISFTGGHLKNDLSYWIENHAPSNATIYIILIAYHTQGNYSVNKRIEEINAETGKNIILKWYGQKIENGLFKPNNSDVLQPRTLPAAVENYAKTIDNPKYGLISRTEETIGSSSFFSSAKNRDILEQEFLKKGVEIIENSTYFKTVNLAKPLGFVGFNSLGFGSLMVTFRNCPNNCPLVFWAEENWHPLFPRKLN